jgi:hypothetical protein
MASELQADYTPGVTVYFLVRDVVARIFNTVTPGFEPYQTANLADYTIAAIQQGTGSGYYVASMPNGLPPGLYNVLAKVQAGGSPAESDLSVGGDTLFWNGDTPGVVLGSAGLDAVLLELGITPSTNLVNDSGAQLAAINARQGLAALLSSVAAVLSGTVVPPLLTRPTGKPASPARLSVTYDSDNNRTAVALRVPN